MNKAERAIIMAAGLGNRMRPVTLTTPKPLVKVNGVRMIDTVIQGLHENGITEIYIVVGYLKEQFYTLEQEYPGVTIIENPYYDTCNNISSLYVARDHIENAMILDGDQILVQQQSTAENGEIVVALIDDNATVKTFYKEDGYYRLQPENDAMEPIIVKGELQILGKVIGVFRFFH